jgi:hypothetical protein
MNNRKRERRRRRLRRKEEEEKLVFVFRFGILFGGKLQSQHITKEVTCVGVRRGRELGGGKKRVKHRTLKGCCLKFSTIKAQRERER